MRRLLTGLLGATLLLGACGDDGPDDDRAAITSIPADTTTSSTTTEPRVPPVDVIPQDPALITEEYVENVLNALYEVSLEAVVIARSDGIVDQPSIRLVEAINSPATRLEAINSLLNLASTGFAGLQEDLSPVRADVLDVIDRDRDCVFVEVAFDSSGLTGESRDVPEQARTFAKIVPAAPDQIAEGNPTAWALDALPATEDGSVPSETCS